MRNHDDCENCGGKGKIGWFKKKPCPWCGGTGKKLKMGHIVPGGKNSTPPKAA